jgi:hypothetical protein
VYKSMEINRVMTPARCTDRGNGRRGPEGLP